ncbi:MAG: protein translocase subunit SecDF [Bacteroidales bacterium]|nr:protein translocase subunit SecDF [Bacteroidales bacterium]
MQTKGFIKLITGFLVLICLFYMSFTFVANHYEDEAVAVAMKAAGGKVDHSSKKYNDAYNGYIDSLSKEKVWLGYYTLQDVREKQLGLGLDLKGGMTATLELSVPDILVELSDKNETEKFKKAIEASKGAADPVHEFCVAFKNNGGSNWQSIFGEKVSKIKENPNVSDNEVEAILKDEVKAQVKNTLNVLATRIEKMGITQPNFQELPNTNRILVELPGVKDRERVKKMLQQTANLEFYQTYKYSEIASDFQKFMAAASGKKVEEPKAEANDSTKTDEKADSAKKEAEPKVAEAKKVADADFDITKALQITGNGCVVGYAKEKDKAAIDSAIARYGVIRNDLKLCWDVKAQENGFVALIALKTVNGRPSMTGDVVVDADTRFEQLKGMAVTMKMNDEGARQWSRLTGANIGRQVAVVLDDVVYSYPNVNQQIDGGDTEITGNFSQEEATDLANVLKSGKMVARPDIISERVIGPSLGEESIKSGVISFVIALVLLMIMMMMVYGVKAGNIANLGLILNLFFIVGVLASFQTVLTLPGIAGIVLTLGMAVDANVLIFERCKEELRNGKNLKAAVADGYKNAFSAIFDGNLTSIITGAILAAECTGPVHGFAITLIVGICCSFFTAVFVTRLVLENFVNKNRFGFGTMTFTTSMVKNFLQNTKADFVGKRGKTSVVVAVAVAVIVAMFFVRPLSLGIDFSGGRNYIVKFDKAVSANELDKVVKAEFGDATSSVITIDNDQTVRVSTNYKVKENTAEVDKEIQGKLFNALKSELGNMTIDQFSNDKGTEGDANKLGIVSVDAVGPSIADDMTREALWAVFWSLVAMALYILLRFRNWAFSLGAVTAVALTSFLVIGFFTLHGLLPFSMEVDQTFIAAILTVIGYQINDTVVVFDRVREYRKLFPKQDLKLTFNNALNSTLSRTMMTSISTLLVLVVIFIFGGESIRAFNFAMILGVIFGTCASLFVAAPTAYALIKRGEKKAAK